MKTIAITTEIIFIVLGLIAIGVVSWLLHKVTNEWWKLKTEREQLDEKLGALQVDYNILNESIKSLYSSKAQLESEELELRAEHDALVNDNSAINNVIENARDKYFSILDSIEVLQNTEESNLINIPVASQGDIEFLLNDVAPRLINKDTLYKLIWTEYIQKPAKVMLDKILPVECAGIYKITNLETKQCYIGKSVNVRKRLTDHLKGACGISTISNQYIHDVMREKGIWNFSYELLEECDRNTIGEREKFYINYFKANGQYGYNQIAGSASKDE